MLHIFGVKKNSSVGGGGSLKNYHYECKSPHTDRKITPMEFHTTTPDHSMEKYL